MDDVLKILLILGFIIFGVVKKAQKKAQNAPADEWGTPTPQPGNPMPEAWGSGEIYAEPIHESPHPEEKPDRGNTIPPFFNQKPPEEGLRTTRITKPMPDERKQPSLTQEDETEDIDIRSMEEVRRGIIWSEILNRKY